MGSTRPSHHVEVTTIREGDINYCLTLPVLSMLGAPSDERSSLSFVLVTVRPLSVNIYRFTCNVYIYIQYIQGLCQAENSSIGYYGSLVIWTVVCLTAAKLSASCTFCVGLRLVQYCEHLHFSGFVWLLFAAWIYEQGYVTTSVAKPAEEKS
jgi:hypothetical protein